MKRRWVTTTVYGKCRGVCDQTVRRWIKKGKIARCMWKYTEGGQYRLAL